MSITDGLFLYMMILFTIGVLAIVSNRLWSSNHRWHLSKSHLMTCRKCGNVFLLKRQEIDQRCPVCGGPSHFFRMPYSGVHERLMQRVSNLK